jgi:hypothetical protein
VFVEKFVSLGLVRFLNKKMPRHSLAVRTPHQPTFVKLWATRSNLSENKFIPVES